MTEAIIFFSALGIMLAFIGYFFIGCGVAFDKKHEAEEKLFDENMRRQFQHWIHYGRQNQ